MSAAGSDRVAQLIAQGEASAFQGRPSDGLAPLHQAMAECEARGDADRRSQVAWLTGVCLAALGRYGSAMGWLRPVLDDASTPQRAHFAGLAATSMASVHRQLNRHDDARSFDVWAARLGASDATVFVDAWMGLAADAVGHGDVADARRALAQALTRFREGSEWRTTVRLEWVRAEIALAARQIDDAMQAAASAVDLAESSGAPRHVAKSLLFLGVARVERARHGDTSQWGPAELCLRRAVALAHSLGTQPLVWPASALLAQLPTVSAQLSAQSRAVAATALRSIIGDLPPAMAKTWAARPEIAQILGS